MNALTDLIQRFLHLDVYLAQLAAEYGVWIYGILFGVLFAETGLVFTPFLPGDSLLLTAGVLSGGGGILDIRIVMAVSLLGPIVGDSVNYWVGRLAGSKLIASGRFVKRSYVDQTAHFFETHGGKTITIARFFPIVRTFAPFMAGVGKMDYGRFFAFSVGGTIAWASLFVGAGYLFGRISWVRDNLEIGVMLVLFLSVLPGAWHFFKSRFGRKTAAAEPAYECDELTEIDRAVAIAEHRDCAEGSGTTDSE